MGNNEIDKSDAEETSSLIAELEEVELLIIERHEHLWAVSKTQREAMIHSFYMDMLLQHNQEVVRALYESV